jgi:signal peptidase I
MKTALRLVRWLLDLALLSLVLSVLSLVIAANIGPRAGHQLVVIRGSSMSPAIPLGAVVDLTVVSPKDLRVGDIVTVKSPGGTVYTHRINRLVNLPDGLYVETEGDAVGRPDTPLQPVSVITGRVAYSLPFLGYLMYMLTIPTGVAAVFSLAITILLCIWLLEELERDQGEINRRNREARARRATLTPMSEGLIG